MTPEQDVIDLPDRSPLRLRLAEAEALLEELRINANRLCDNAHRHARGGTYEADCRRTLRKVDDYQKAAYLAGRGPQRAVRPASLSPIHGQTCNKRPHDNPSGGYLHGEDDDSPYNVDGWPYCGRCHRVLDPHESSTGAATPQEN